MQFIKQMFKLSKEIFKKQKINNNLYFTCKWVLKKKMHSDSDAKLLFYDLAIICKQFTL